MDHEQELTERIIGCAIAVHRALGPGLLESAYVGALCVELAHHGISYDRGRRVPLEYRGVAIGDYYIDLVVENNVVVEIKSVLRLEPVFGAKVC